MNSLQKVSTPVVIDADASRNRLFNLWNTPLGARIDSSDLHAGLTLRRTWNNSDAGEPYHGPTPVYCPLTRSVVLPQLSAPLSGTLRQETEIRPPK